MSCRVRSTRQGHSARALTLGSPLGRLRGEASTAREERGLAGPATPMRSGPGASFREEEVAKSAEHLGDSGLVSVGGGGEGDKNGTPRAHSTRWWDWEPWGL